MRLERNRELSFLTGVPKIKNVLLAKLSAPAVNTAIPHHPGL